MKKIIPGLVLFVLLLSPVVVLAQVPVEPQTPTTQNLPKILQNIINWALGILVAIAALFIIIAGYFFVTAQGDPEKVSKARMFVLWALVGVLVGVISWALVNFVLTDIIA